MHSAAGSAASAAGGGGGAASASQQANDMTRNILLGVPKEGLSPSSEEAAELHAAEVFVGNIQQEILAYDIANAQAMEAYARKAWSRLAFLGRRARAAPEAETPTGEKEQGTHAGFERTSAHQRDGGDAMEFSGGLAGLDPERAAEAVMATGSSTFLHTQTEKPSRGGFRVERTSAVDKGYLDELARKKGGPLSSSLEGSRPLQGQDVKAAAPANTWLFKRRHPGWTPLMQRWWIPWLCAGAIALVWTPDVWKLRTLYYLDWQYTLLRRNIHKAYWRLTMTKEDYDTLLADIESQKPSKVKATDCPF